MTASRIHCLLAALMGAVGVALWATAAHRTGGASLVTAAQFLLLHASAVFAITAVRKQGLIRDRVASLAVSGLILGTILFSGDLAARAFLGPGLFPMAAPAGGVLMILSWIMAAVASLVPNNTR